MEVDDIFGYDKFVATAASDFPATQ